MLAVQSDILTLIAAVAVFGLVLAIWLGAILLWSARRLKVRKRIETRMGIDEGRAESRVLRLWHEGKEATTIVPGREWHVSLSQRMSRTLRNAGIKGSPGVILTGVAGVAALAGILVTLFTGNIPLGVGLGLAIIYVSWMLVNRFASKNATAFESQLVDALMLASRSLRAGHPLPGAFRLIAEEIAAPVGPLFGQVYQEQTLGLSMEDAVRKMTRESGSNDLKLFATCVIVQLRSGGNLADMMDRLAVVIRDRIRQARRFRVLTAQTQFSKRVLLLWPVILFLALNILAPEYINTLFEKPGGRVLLGIAGGLFLLGLFVMNRWSTIRS